MKKQNSEKHLSAYLKSLDGLVDEQRNKVEKDILLTGNIIKCCSEMDKCIKQESIILDDVRFDGIMCNRGRVVYVVFRLKGNITAIDYFDGDDRPVFSIMTGHLLSRRLSVCRRDGDSFTLPDIYPEDKINDYMFRRNPFSTPQSRLKSKIIRIICLLAIIFLCLLYIMAIAEI